MIEKDKLGVRLDTKANAKECEFVQTLDPKDFVEDGPAAVAMCNYVKACYNYMHTTKALAKKGITQEAMARHIMFCKGSSKGYGKKTLSKVKKTADECASKSKNLICWDLTGSVTTYFKTFELLHETKIEM